MTRRTEARLARVAAPCPRRGPGISWLLLLWPLLVGCLLPLRPTWADDLSQREQQLHKLQQRIAGIRARLDAARGQRTKLNRQLEQSEQAIGRLARRLRVLQGQLKRQTRRVETLRVEEREQAQSLQQQRTLLARQVRAAYMMGRQEQLRILLNQEDPAGVSRLLTYFDYLNRERARRMADIRQQLDRLAETRKTVELEQARLAHLEREQRERKLALEKEQFARRKVVAQLAEEIEGQGAHLARLHKDEKQLQALLKGLQQALADIPVEPNRQIPFSKVRGHLPWPVKGVIRKAFGDPKIGQLRWDGVMIAAPEGREVRAVHAGRVAFADWLRGFGLLIILDHGDGYMTLYGHNQSLFKEAGDWVETGETIATTGNTGGRRETGVYFAIRHNGKPVNPVRWCRKAQARRVG